MAYTAEIVYVTRDNNGDLLEVVVDVTGNIPERRGFLLITEQSYRAIINAAVRAGEHLRLTPAQWDSTYLSKFTTNEGVQVHEVVFAKFN